MERRIKDFLRERKDNGLLREMVRVSGAGGGTITIDGKDYVNFSSNDYLGLSSHPEIARAARGSLEDGVGSSASRLMSGSTHLHHVLEERIAAFKRKPAALVFNSGYQANVGIISALFGRDDAIFSDRLNHASVIDGILLSGARLLRFRHNDMDHLEELLHRERGNFAGALIVTETVFSMDGDRAPLGRLAWLKKEFDCALMVDEAHATGVFGRKGSGLVEEAGIAADVDIIMGTFSKALGSFGAYAAVSEDMRDYLVNTCRSFIYSTSLPRAIIAADIAAMDVVEREPHRRETLLVNAEHFRARLEKAGLNVRGDSQIVPVITGDNGKTMRVAELLKKKGYWVTPARPPTVPKGEERLRISLSYDHSREVLDELADVLEYAVLKQLTAQTG